MKKEKQEALLNDAREWFLKEYGNTPEKAGYPHQHCWYQRMFWMEIPSVIYASSKQIADEYMKDYNVLVSVMDFSIVAVFLFAVASYALVHFEKTALILTALAILIVVFFVFVFWIIRAYARIVRKYDKQIIIFRV